MDYILTESWVQRILTTGEFQVLELRRYGCTLDQIADMTNMTTGQVRYKVGCIRKKFQPFIAKIATGL
jgi:DNA-binding CsgD family transcriptional regulator